MANTLEYDPEADAIYIRVSDTGAAFLYSVDMPDGRRIDMDVTGAPIGIEFLNVSRGMELADVLWVLEGKAGVESGRVPRDAG